MAEIDCASGTCDSHIKEPSFLFQLVKVLVQDPRACGGTGVREDAFLHSGNEYVWEFEALGGMKCHQHHAVRLRVVAIDIRDEGDIFQKSGEVGLRVVVGEVLGAFQEALDIFSTFKKIVLAVLQFKLTHEVGETLDFLDGGGDRRGGRLQQLAEPIGEPPKSLGLLASALETCAIGLGCGVGDNWLGLTLMRSSARKSLISLRS